MLKKRISALSLAVVLLSSVTINASTIETISQDFAKVKASTPQENPTGVDDYYLTINGKSIAERPFAVNGRTLVPLRVISEEMGAKVGYTHETLLVTIEKGDTKIELVIGSNVAVVNGTTVTLEAPSMLKDGRTFVPVRFVAESLGVDVEWNAPRREVKIGEDKYVYNVFVPPTKLEQAFGGTGTTLEKVKIPTIHLAKEQAVPVSGRGGWVNASPQNKIQGTIIAKYGNPKHKMHTYGSKNQAEYDAVVEVVKKQIESITEEDFLGYTYWLLLQAYLENPNISDDYTLGGCSIGDFKAGNFKRLMHGLKKGLITPEEAENVMIYALATAKVVSLHTDAKELPGGKAYSAYQALFRKEADCDARAQVDLIVADILGFNSALLGNPGHAWSIIDFGGRYWYNYGTQPDINKANSLMKMAEVLEMPSFDMPSNP